MQTSLGFVFLGVRVGIILHLTLATQLDLDADVFGVCFFGGSGGHNTTPDSCYATWSWCRRFWVWVGWVRVGIILHLTLATQLDLDADVFGVVFFGWVRVGIILHLTLATQLDLDADVFGVCFFWGSGGHSTTHDSCYATWSWCRRFWVWFFWVRVGIILHLTLATQLDLDADVFGVVFLGFGWA